MLARSVEHGEGPVLAGFQGVIVLAFSWFLISGVFAFTADKHPYSLLILSINQGMDDALKLYQKNEQITAESFYLLSQTITQIKDWLIRLMPAILISIDLMLVWLAMALGNRLLQKHTGAGPWPDYQCWQLPEKLVWSVIAAASLALMPVPMARTTGFNILLIVSIIYCFQGLAIVLFFLDKWKTPLYVRFLIYMILFFQSLGIIFLSIIGLADVWFTFRQADKQDPNQKNTE
jgi:uncharacterized protein YybS (DUF2232 family)